jgi:DNA-binding LytR/AlgR family response regulator
MKTLIVEEEIATLAILQKTLQTHVKDGQVQYYASNLTEALQKIQTYSPHLLILDLDTDKRNWLHLVNYIERTKGSQKLATILIGSVLDPEVLTTSFLLNPIALLIKPLEERKLIQSLTLANQKIKENDLLKCLVDTKIPYERIIKNLQSLTSTLCLKLINGEYENIQLEECMYFHLEFAVLRIKFKNEEIKNLAESLSSIQQKLPKERFFRISKQTIVNKVYIRIYLPKNRTVTMLDGHQFKVSRRKGKEFTDFLVDEMR